MATSNRDNRPGILVTRPRSQGLALCRQLEQRKYHVVHVPVMEIEPLQDSGHLQQVQRCFANQQTLAGIIVVSVNAAEQAIDWFERHPPPPTVTFFSVGQSTAQYLLEHLAVLNGRRVVFPATQMDSEGLLALPELQAARIKDRHFLILRGVGGRDVLASTLRTRGATVESCELYRRICPPNEKALRECLVDIGIIVVNSVESLDNLVMLAGQGLENAIQLKTLVVPGERVAAAARTAGFRHIICAANATDAAVIDAISRH